jgi:transposase
MPNVSTLEVIETGARRRWTREEKLRIVAESFSAPRVVSATARRYGLSSSQLFKWRRLALEAKPAAGNEEPGFVPALVMPEVNDSGSEAPPSDGPAAKVVSGSMVIVLSERCRIIVGRDVDAAALRRVLEVLEGR